MIDYYKELKHHYRPKKGWINDPNGLVYFKGYYHIFYQHSPNFERPWHEFMHWGHARTKDFIEWEELPVALTPGEDGYDQKGCWSGTAIVKDDVLYLFYASIDRGGNPLKQTISVAYSEDGINFTKYHGNPVIAEYPKEGSEDFRDPAVCCINGQYYCVVASGNPEDKAGRLLLYKSENMFDWDYIGVMSEWADCKFTECPSFMEAEDGYYLLTTSVCPLDKEHYFAVMYGDFKDDKFTPKYVAEVDKGPDQYAGQVFRDDKGRNILITWIPGWKYDRWFDKNVGCMSVPREMKLIDGKVYGYPVEEVQHLLKDEDESLKRTPTGFIVERERRDPFVYEGKIDDLKLIRDECILEVFVNGGQEIFSILL